MRFLTTVVFLVPVAAILLTGVYAKPSSVVGDFDGVDWTVSVSLENQEPLLSTTTAQANPYGSLRGTNLKYSGVCERKGVDQSAGYANITTTNGTTKHMWFWFFPARNGNANAPIALWFSGGPGVSSMGAVAARHGPCRVTENNSQDTENNIFSWNNEVNMLYIDQPIGTGFSYGTGTAPTPGTTDEAAQDVWKFLQVFFQHPKFEKYQSRSLGIWTESYGGHYGPRFSAYILDQNTAIANSRIPGVKLNLKFLGIGNGITDALVQYPGYLTYTKYNPYEPLVPNGEFTLADAFWNKNNNTCDIAYVCKGCKALINKCRNTETPASNEVCKDAQVLCQAYMTEPLLGDHNLNNIKIKPRAANDPNTPDVTTYINSVRTRIGAGRTWSSWNPNVADAFEATGDWVRSSRLHLQRVINSPGVRTLIYAGDADYNINFHTVEALVDTLRTQYADNYKTQEWTTYKVRGQTAGIYKQAGRFSYLRVYGAGHSVPAYDYGSLRRGETAFQMFNQIMSDASLSSTDSPTGEPDLNADLGCHFGN